MDYGEGRLLDPDSRKHTDEAVLRHTDYISREQSRGQKGLKGWQKARPRKWEGCINKGRNGTSHGHLGSYDHNVHNVHNIHNVHNVHNVSNVHNVLNV